MQKTPCAKQQSEQGALGARLKTSSNQFKHQDKFYEKIIGEKFKNKWWNVPLRKY